jgi:hypothetical protein
MRRLQCCVMMIALVSGRRFIAQSCTHPPHAEPLLYATGGDAAGVATSSSSAGR